ncbi:iron-sulfur cluster biosynthesis family protein [Fictibacillus nanhaiensis]|uniref:iron-sulfur cluster biosynthesis family protein n=1 Tax=Fictibacillus nanhaiensis TaxID=742169 RepID=UPI001C989FD5|nr:iron-sulfur cluster biosynthesis family protein [Fictibacillus nanhaiensis]MBY6035605.1 iron-sulfur cluster biosynthesis family protein [Fictibacillus nanhaiensis]
MEISFTRAALERLKSKRQGKEGFIKLKHDTEGCGCVVSGVSALWLVDQIEPNDTKISTNGPDVYMEYNTEVFFDQKMSIDAQPGNHFSLKSPAEILNSSMKFYDQTKQNTGS